MLGVASLGGFGEVLRIEAVERGSGCFRPRRVQLLRDYVTLRTAEWEAKQQQTREPS